jgi:hypothetical protein
MSNTDWSLRGWRWLPNGDQSGVRVTTKLLAWFAIIAASWSCGSRSTRPATRVPAIPKIECVTALDGGARAPEDALAAARRALRKRTVTNQSGTVHMTPRTYTVIDVAWAFPGAPPGPARQTYDWVRAECGLVQAERTWRISVNVSAAQLPGPPLVLLASRTADGWRVTSEDADP